MSKRRGSTVIPNYPTKECGSMFRIPQNPAFTHTGKYYNVCFLKSVLEGLKMYYKIDTREKEIDIFDIFIDRMYEHNLVPNNEIEVPRNRRFIEQIERDWDVSINVFTEGYIRAYPLHVNNDNYRIINIQYVNENHFVLIEHYDPVDA